MPAELPPFVMPKPYSVVVWRPALGLDQVPAFVTASFKNTISVVAFPLDARVGMPKDGVRHIDDPGVSRISPDEGGVWEYTEDQKMLRNVLGLDTVQIAVK